jgi:5-methylthioadenosine/S-adenosylhomocysteine deaminase
VSLTVRDAVVVPVADAAPDYPWVRVMMEVFARADAEDLYLCTLHGALDFLANGVTSAYNFTQSRVTWLFDPATASNRLGAVHPTEMVATAAGAGAGMVWQPTSNGRLGSGFADVVRLREAGMRVGIGLDDQSCTDISDPFANMRMGLYATRALHTDAGILMPRDVLRMHTLGAAEVLGVADRVGSLEVGKFADFVVVDHRAPSTGPVWDVLATYVLACGLRNLKRGYVGGRLASAEGRCTSPLAADADGELHARITRAAAAAGLEPAL